MTLETLKELEDCLKKLDSGVSRKRCNWATQQKAEINKLELGSQLRRTWQKLLRDHFEEAMRTSSSASQLMANPFVRTTGQLMFAWSLVGIELETLTSHDKLKLGGKSLEIYQTFRPWWVTLETLKELEDCLKKLDSGVSRKRCNWATQQKAEINKLELGSQLRRTWQKLLRDHFEEAMRTSSSASQLMANPFVRTTGQLMFAWSLVGIELETLTSHDKLKLGGKSLEIYQTFRPWWVALETLKELEDCLKKLDSGVSRKRCNWATQQKAEINKLELGSQLRGTWQKLLSDHFEEAMRTSSSASQLMANPFVRTTGQLMFAWSLVGIELETLTSHVKLKLGGKSLEKYQTLMQHVARDNSGLSLARRRDASCFLSWIMSVMTDSTILACQQRAIGSKAMERRVSAVILNVYQSTGIEKEDGSRQSLESHRKLDEIRRCYNKKFAEKHDVHRKLASSEEYLKP